MRGSLGLLGKAGLAEDEDLHLKCFFLGLVRGRLALLG